MNKTKKDFSLQKFDQENVDAMLTEWGFDVNNYFIAMTKPSILSRIVVGDVIDFANRNCIFCFSETEINLIMLSRLDNKKVTEIININRNEIKNMKLSNVLISYKLDMKMNDSTMKFQVFKKVGGFTKTSNSIEQFKKMY